MTRSDMKYLTDEQILKEFVDRFSVDGAVLIYLDGKTESGLSRWKNSNGKNWANKVLHCVKANIKEI